MKPLWPLLVFGALSWTSQAGARESASAHLSVQPSAALSRCTTAERLMQQVEARLQRRVWTDEDEADIVVQTAVEPAADGATSATVTLHSSHGAFWGKRAVVVGDCPGLEDSLVLMLSLTVDIRREEVEQREQRDRLSVTRLGPVASLTGIAGLLPNFAVGPALGLGVQSPSFGWLDLQANLLLPQTQGSPERARYGALLLALRWCPLQLHLQRTSLGACGAARGGMLSGQGRGLPDTYQERRGVFSAGLGVRGAWEFAEPFFLHAGLGGEVVAQGSEFHYESGSNRIQLHRTGAALLIGEVGFGLGL